MPSKACVVKSSSVSPSGLIVLDANLYGPDAARPSAIWFAVWFLGLIAASAGRGNIGFRASGPTTKLERRMRVGLAIKLIWCGRKSG
jgi:hypothetical protein